MSGHSKWHRIKRQKQSEDQKRGKIFSKLSRKITVAARNGRDPERNSDLRQAILDAKANNMPKDNIERAILRGTGELPGTEFFETTYEGYGPGGVALFIDCVTDNKKRTTSEIRHILESNGGKLGSEGCVSYMFKRIGLIIITKGDIPEMAIYDAAIEAGALDIKEEDDFYDDCSLSASLPCRKACTPICLYTARLSLYAGGRGNRRCLFTRGRACTS